MKRVLIAALVLGGLASPVMGDICGYNAPLHHALWPEHKQKLVVAGTISKIVSDRQIRCQVSDVILGDEKFRGQTLTIGNNIVWPKLLVPLQEGTNCILVLGRWSEREDHNVATVVAGRVREYPSAADSVQAQAILADELTAQLKVEKSEKRQRAILRQLAPILRKEKAEEVEQFLTSGDVWVRRAALAALVYATEEPKYLELAANDVQGYFKQYPGEEWIKGPDEDVQTRPDWFLFEYYFFLARRSWTWGSMWNEKEAEKHRRIVDGMLKFKILDEATQERLLGK